jgi:hypothetical protein
MRPVYDYNDIHFEENHKHCQARYFVTLYKGDIYKCPPIGVLEHTLTTFNLTETEYWQPYIKDYNKLRHLASDSDIINWFKLQDTPEKVCNMCGFSGPDAVGQNIERSHYLKLNWKVKSG